MRLKTSRVTLIHPSQCTTPSTSGGSGTATARPTHTAAMTTVTSGPATAMRNSAPGLGIWAPMRATPPNTHRVMPSMGTPTRRA